MVTRFDYNIYKSELADLTYKNLKFFDQSANFYITRINDTGKINNLLI